MAASRPTKPQRRYKCNLKTQICFFRIVKEQPIVGKPTAERATSDRALGAEFSRILVEPTGIEPVTSCLQSRRSPS